MFNPMTHLKIPLITRWSFPQSNVAQVHMSCIGKFHRLNGRQFYAGSSRILHKLIPFTGLGQAALIIGLFVVRPHDTSLSQLIRSDGGSAYSILAGPLVLQVVGAGIAWLQAWSVQRALLRANRAEELAEARDELSRQARLTAERNQRLEEGIAQILETHRQVAAGHLEVRAPTQEDHELWQIAHSLNTLLMRFQQYVRGEQRSAFQRRSDQTGGHRPVGQG